LSGVLFGIGLSLVKLLYTFSQLKISLHANARLNRVTLSLKGSATFLRLPRLARALERVPPGCELDGEFDRLSYIHPACLELLRTWEQQQVATGGKVVADWKALTARFTDDPASMTTREAGNASERVGLQAPYLTPPDRSEHFPGKAP